MRTLPNVSSKFGAPMGRRNNMTEREHPVKFHMQRLRWVDGDYDQGGAYWGRAPGSVTSIYWAYGDAEHDEQEMFVRAPDRNDAKRQVLALFPNARFFR